MFGCTGGCHCGRVRFQIQVPGEVTVHRCNCSICTKSAYLHLIDPAGHFELLSGETSLTDYRFHTGVARHLCCSHCGIKSFYVPRSHPESYSVHLTCVDLPEEVAVKIEDFDGQNWSQSRARLK